MSFPRTPLLARDAPPGRGPFPQALAVGPFVFVSGQGPLDPATNAPVAGSFAVQVTRAIDNVEAILASAGLGLDDVAKVTVYLADLSRVEEFNALYANRFRPPRPARTLVEAGLRGIDVELDVIALGGGFVAREDGP